MYTIIRYCPLCGEAHYIDVSESSYDAYTGGALVQDAFPELSPVEREFVKSGYCPACQEMIFGNGHSENIKALPPLWGCDMSERG